MRIRILLEIGFAAVVLLTAGLVHAQEPKTMLIHLKTSLKHDDA
jgi:hypothetical protein